MSRRLAAAIALATLAACGGGSSKSTPPPPPPPPPPPEPVVLTTFEPASTLIGQSDWTSVPASNPCAAGSLNQPYGAAAWDGTNLIVPDTFSGRLLLFAPIPPAEADPATMPPATGELGEPTSLTTCNDANSTLLAPQAPTVSGSAIVVSDSGFHQAFLYPSVPTDPVSTAGRVTVGDGLTDCTATSLSDPRGALLAGVTLIVADTGHNRVLFFEPDVHDLSKYVLVMVLGQVDPSATGTFCAANDTDSDHIDGNSSTLSLAPDARTMNAPKAVWTDGTHLVVADSGNNRLLVWNSFPTTSGQAADAVIGQGTGATRFEGTTHGAAADQLWDPESVASDGTQLFVADTGNHRVLVYPSVPSTSGVAATIVLGQAAFGCSAANDPGNVDATACTGTAGTAPTQRTLKGPTGVSVVNGLLSVTDTGNGRLLVYRPPAP